jgi:hypothetical protein
VRNRRPPVRDPKWVRARAKPLGEVSKGKPRHAVWRKLWLIIGGVALLAGLAATVISLVQTANARPSNVSTLVMEMGRAGEYTLGAYAVPLDAPFAEIPADLAPSPDFPGSFVCSKEQHEWLARYGKPFVQSLWVTLRNTAESGSITVRDFKAEGRRETPSTPLVPFYCDMPIGGIVAEQHAILPTDNRSAAYWGEPATHEGAPEGFAKGTPLVYDLAAGESAQIRLTPEQRQDFEGAVKVTVLAGDKQTVVTIPVHEMAQSGKEEQVFIPKFTLPEEGIIHIGDDNNYQEGITKPFSWTFYGPVSGGTTTHGNAFELARHLEGLRS